jgi:hypothetical protein
MEKNPGGCAYVKKAALIGEECFEMGNNPPETANAFAGPSSNNSGHAINFSSLRNNPLLKNTQLFRLTRMNYGENPYPSDTDQSTGKLSSQNGIFVQILERENNTCLRLSEDNNTISFGTCLGGYSDGNKIGGP